MRMHECHNRAKEAKMEAERQQHALQVAEERNRQALAAQREQEAAKQRRERVQHARRLPMTVRTLKMGAGAGRYVVASLLGLDYAPGS